MCFCFKGNGCTCAAFTNVSIFFTKEYFVKNIFLFTLAVYICFMPAGQRALIIQADKAFRQYLKNKWGAPEPICCVTCKTHYRHDLIDIGHIIKRDYFATRWLEDNALPQCIDCNRNRGGGGIEDLVGVEKITQLRTVAYCPQFRLHNSFIQEIINKYEVFY